MVRTAGATAGVRYPVVKMPNRCRIFRRTDLTLNQRSNIARCAVRFSHHKARESVLPIWSWMLPTDWSQVVATDRFKSCAAGGTCAGISPPRRVPMEVRTARNHTAMLFAFAGCLGSDALNDAHDSSPDEGGQTLPNRGNSPPVVIAATP